MQRREILKFKLLITNKINNDKEDGTKHFKIAEK